MACITTTEGRRDAARDVRMEKVASTGIGIPAFGGPNPKPRFRVQPSDYAPFLGHIPDEEFARLVGAPVPSESISFIPIEPRGSGS